MAAEIEPHITAREFQNFREDVGREFKEVHECTERIEGKIDDFHNELDQKLNPILDEFQKKQEKQKRRWDMKMTVFGLALGAGFSVVTTAIIFMLRLG